MPTVPAHGFKRRVRALMRIGWTQKEIAAELGIAQGNLALKLRTNERVRRATHEAAVEVFERHCMTARSGAIAKRTARIAAKNGWPPPLAWTDIDDPNEQPKHNARGSNDPAAQQRHLDMAVVWRLVDEGVRVRQLTAAEAAEACRILVARGVNPAQIEKRYRLNPKRYEEGAA